MTEVTADLAAVPRAIRSIEVAKNPRVEHRYFATVSILLLLLSIVAFTGSAFYKTSHGANLATPRFVLHGIAGFLWMIFFVVQTQLVTRGNVARHRALGKVGVILYVLIVLTTLYLLFTGPAVYPEMPIEQMSQGITVHTVSIIAGLPLFLLAIYWRTRPYLHKRLMYFLTIGFASVGFSRLPMAFGAGENMALSIVLAFAFVVALLVHDCFQYKGWRKFTMLGCLAYLFVSNGLLMALANGLVTSTDGWIELLEAIRAG